MPPRLLDTTEIKHLLASGRRDHREGDLDKALAAYQQVLQQSPGHPDALYLVGLILYRQNQSTDAMMLVERACIADPQHALAHASLAQIYQDQGAYKRSVNYFRRAAELEPLNPQTLNGLGLSLSRLNKHQPAFEAFNAAISLSPEMFEAHINLGNLLREAGRLNAAKRHYLRCLDINAGSALANNNLGVLHQMQQQLEPALIYFTAALKIDPGYAEAHNNLGAVLLDQAKLEAALSQFKQALTLKPELSQAAINAGMALQNLGLHTQAAAQLDSVLELEPDNLTVRWLRCIVELRAVYDSTGAIEHARHNYAACLRALTKKQNTMSGFSVAAAISMQAYLLPYQGRDDLELQSMAGDFLCRHAQAKKLRTCSDSARLPGAIRVGMVSAFFYDHSNWKIPLQGWLKGLSAECEVHAYHTGTGEDAATIEARVLASKFHSGLSVQQFAQQIIDDDIDVLIYPEVGMHPLTTRLAIQRLAPVQCASWGHPLSSGLPTMDYFISSDLMEPQDAQASYREKLIRLPGLSFCWTRPVYDERQSFSRADFGLASGGPIFLCVQNLSKYLPQYDYMLVEIARRLGSVQIVFIEGTAATTKALKSRLQRCFRQANLNVAKQLIFLPRQDKDRYHALNLLANVFLDTPEWSACNSSLEALICDLPVVTLPGQLMRSRHTLAFYQQMDYRALIARDAQHYIELAVRLVQDDAWCIAQRKKISQCRHRLEGDRVPVKALAALIQALPGSAHVKVE